MGGLPIDACDACCAQHDACYQVNNFGMITDPETRAVCDVPFVKCLQGADCNYLKRQLMIRFFAGGHAVDGRFPQWHDPEVDKLMEYWRGHPDAGGPEADVQAPNVGAPPPMSDCGPCDEFEPTAEERALRMLDLGDCYRAPLCPEEPEKECHCV